jgi:uncharacterized protein YkwD
MQREDVSNSNGVAVAGGASASRRLFLSAAAQSLAYALAARAAPRAAPPQLTKGDLELFRDTLLQLVNSERSAARVPKLALDDLASRVADEHARDLASGNFLSHWGRDGRKPYHRYSFAGGSDAVAENVSAAHKLASVTRNYIYQTLKEMHQKMHAETPPDDGHRRTILGPNHTHVGFGIALSGHELRLVELYVARHVRIEPYESSAKRGATVRLRGRFLGGRSALHYVEVCHEPTPRAPDVGWLSAPRPYGLPDDFVILRPKLSGGVVYADRVEGVVESDAEGGFQFPLKLEKEGVYTVVVWAKKRDSGEKFITTNACILVE